MTNRAKKMVATISDYKKVFNTEIGKRVLYDMCKQCHFFQTSFNPENPEMTSFNEGQRNVILFIFSKLKKNEALLYEMLKKHEEEENEYQNAN